MSKDTHGSPELDEDARNLEAMGMSAGATLGDLGLLLDTHEYAFDCVLTAAIRVQAQDEVTARALLASHLDSADTNAGAWPNGNPILFEASLDRIERLYEVDGNETDTPCLPSYEQLVARLCENQEAWEGEEDSVKDEHDTLIAQNQELLDRCPDVKGWVTPPDDKKLLRLDQRELDTIIAALRLWQHVGKTGEAVDADIVAIATNGRSGYDAALSEDEIDELIEERINV